jgi:hypothetical protein
VNREPKQPFIADRIEAALCVGWCVLFVVGFVLASLVSPIGWVVMALAPIDILLLRARINRRVGSSGTRVWRVWLGQKAQIHAWRLLATGKTNLD